MQKLATSPVVSGALSGALNNNGSILVIVTRHGIIYRLDVNALLEANSSDIVGMSYTCT